MSASVFKAAACLLLCLLALVGAATSLTNSGLGDFGSFVLAGKADERGLNPYGVHQGLVEESGLNLGFDDRPYSPNLNPPISIYAFRLLADADPGSARFVLRAVSVLVYLVACVALLRAYPWQQRPLTMLWLISLAGFWYTLWMGQVYVLLLAAGLAAWLLLEKGRNPVLVGVLIGVTVAVKPNFAVWPLVLLLSGHGRPAIWAGMSALLLSAIPLAVEGPGIYGQWLDAAQGYSRGAIAANGSLVGTASRLGFAPAGYVIAGALTLAGVVYAWRRRPGVMEASSVALVLTLLAGPLTWLGYTVFALPVLMSRRWQRWEIAVAATLVVPVWLTTISGEIHLAGLLILGGLLTRDAIRNGHTHREADVPIVAAPSPETA